MAVKSTTKEVVQTFATEACLVEGFLGKLQAGRTKFGVVQAATEWDHRAGFVDVLARDSEGSLLAFEAKLSDWRRAFLQAYRNTAYANRAYVLLPQTTVHRALRDREEFEFRGIGLCSFDGKQLHVLIEAAEHDALLAWVRTRAHDFFDGQQLDERRPRSRCSRAGAVPAARLHLSR